MSFPLKEYSGAFDVSWKDIQAARHMENPGDELKRAVRAIRIEHGLSVAESHSVLPGNVGGINRGASIGSTDSIAAILKEVYGPRVVQRMSENTVLWNALTKKA